MLTLHQFETSHYNDKARWALDYKQLEHLRESYLPGPHVPQLRKLSGGRSSTPLLQHAGGCVSGSSAIIDWLESEYPQPALYPPAPADRERALQIQSEFDKVVGPASRTAVFSVFINEPAYLTANFGGSKGWLKRTAYRATFPLVEPLIRKANGVNPANIADALKICHDTLDRLAADTAATGYLVGDRFSIADLTAAALLAPLSSVDHPDMKRKEPMPESFRVFLQQWRDHPAIHWVHRMYENHRPSRAGGAQQTGSRAG